MSKPIKAALNLKQFLLRQEVLKLYRTLYRTINKIPDESSKKDLKSWLRDDFEKNRNKSEEIDIKMLIHQGNRSLTELKTSLELSGVSVKTTK